MDDVRAVLDAAGTEQTVLWGAGADGGSLCAMYAATYPERVTALAFWNGRAKSARTSDYPWEWGSWLPEDEYNEPFDAHWGDDEAAAQLLRSAGAPSVADDPAAIRWAARVLRRMGAPSDRPEWEGMYDTIDFRSVLPLVHVPTLAVFRAFPPDPDGTAPYEDLAARVPGARSVCLPPGEFPPWGGAMEPAVAAVRDFVRLVAEEEASFSRTLATVVFTDIVGSTASAAALGDSGWRDLVERHHAIVRGLLARDRGVEVDTAGDGFFATFDGPARGVRCALAVVEAVKGLGIEVRAGVHTGEVETIDGKAGGLAVVLGARIGALARPSQVLTSQTVKDLTVGSGVEFVFVGEQELKGLPDRWRIYEVPS
jgi:class 3 adenylate cyclase